MALLCIDHIQLSIPPGRLDEALPFYLEVLGFNRVPKPAEFASHGGAWMQQGTVQLHLGEEKNFAVDGRAHTALRVDNLDAILGRARGAGYRTRLDEGPRGFRRASVFDVFGNRVELMQAIDS